MFENQVIVSCAHFWRIFSYDDVFPISIPKSLNNRIQKIYSFISNQFDLKNKQKHTHTALWLMYQMYSSRTNDKNNKNADIRLINNNSLQHFRYF